MNESRHRRTRDRDGRAGPSERHADLGEQMETLLLWVWECERNWDLDDRIDASTRYGR